MNELSIPFADGLASGLHQLSGAQPLFVNFLVDVNGAMSVRPGIQAWSDFPVSSPVTNSPVIGMFQWVTAQGSSYIIFVTADRMIWAWLSPGLVVPLSSASDKTTQLDGSLRPVFTFDSTRVAMVGGGAPQQWQGTGLSSRLAPNQTLPDGSPLALTHITYNAQRFIGLDFNNSGIFQWTDPGPPAHATWPIVGAYFQEAEASPDPAVALFANTNEVFVFGTQTLQVYLPDPQVVYSAAMSVQSGCGAAGSVIPIDDNGAFAWLDQKHRFGVSDGRGGFQSISTPQIDNDVMSHGFVVSDCFGQRIHIGGWDLLLWIFPTQQRGFCYERNTGKWVGEFRSIDQNGNWVAWAPSSYLFVAGTTPQQNLHLVGMSNGTIAQLTFDSDNDLGTKIKAVSRTGFQTRGTFNNKACDWVRLQFLRGQTQSGPAPVVELRYRDSPGTFRPVTQWSAGVAGDYAPIVEKRNLGIYRQRQWEIEWSGGGSFVMTGATETFTTLDT